MICPWGYRLFIGHWSRRGCMMILVQYRFLQLAKSQMFFVVYIYNRKHIYIYTTENIWLLASCKKRYWTSIIMQPLRDQWPMNNRYPQGYIYIYIYIDPRYLQWYIYIYIYNGNIFRVIAWPFVRGIHRSPVNSTHKGQWSGALIFFMICVWMNGWVNSREAGDLRRYCAHYDVGVMTWYWLSLLGINQTLTTHLYHSFNTG